MQGQVLYRLESGKDYGIELADAHCHLDVFDSPGIAISDAKMSGVRIMITAGGSRSSSMAAISIADGRHVFAVIGVDPEGAENDSNFVEELKGLVKSHAAVVGIGEIGLDYKISANRELQRQVFEEQIEIAKALDIPIVVHARQALEEVMAIVRGHEVKKAMFHYFEGDENQAAALADDGYMISIPPFETSKRRRIISALNINSIVVETDSPVVGRSPIDVIKTVEWIAQIKGLPFSDAAHKTTENVKKLFSL